MSTSNPAFCGVCNAVFNEDERCPRNLPCSHHLCSECIVQLIAQDANACPFCHQEFNEKSAEDFMINHALLDYIKAIPVLRRKPYKVGFKVSSAYQQRITDFKEEVCKNNKKVRTELTLVRKDVERLMIGERKLKKGLATLKRFLGEDVPAHIQKLLTETESYHEKSNTASLKLKDLVDEILKNEEKLVSAKRILDSAITWQDTSAVIDETEEVNMVVREWIESLKEYISKEDDQRQERNKELNGSERFQNNFMKFINFEREQESLYYVPITGASACKMDLSSQITALGLWEMRTPVRLMIEQGRVFALQMLNNVRRVAKITIENDKLLLYSLQDEEEAIPKAYYVEYAEVQRLVTTPSTIFLDLRHKGLLVGRVHILLNDNGKNNNMHFHFTGGIGQSYSNTPLQIANKGQLLERVLFGYQMAEAVSGNTAAYSLTNANSPQSNPGSVWLLDVNRKPPLIGVHTGPFQPNAGTLIGNVEGGLKILSDAIYWSQEVKDIIVSQCGLFLNTKEPLTS